MKKYNLKSFPKVLVRMPEHPEVKKIYSFTEYKVYINVDARPGANVILFEPPRPADPAPWLH